MSWGEFLGKIADQFQGRKERNRNREEAIKREMAEILKEPADVRNTRRYERLASELRKIQQVLKNN